MPGVKEFAEARVKGHAAPAAVLGKVPPAPAPSDSDSSDTTDFEEGERLLNADDSSDEGQRRKKKKKKKRTSRGRRRAANDVKEYLAPDEEPSSFGGRARIVAIPVLLAVLALCVWTGLRAQTSRHTGNDEASSANEGEGDADDTAAGDEHAGEIGVLPAIPRIAKTTTLAPLILTDFDRLPIAKRFYARGDASCVRKPPPTDTSPLLALEAVGGWGAKIKGLGVGLALAAHFGRALAVWGTGGEFMDPGQWFERIRHEEDHPKGDLCDDAMEGMVFTKLDDTHVCVQARTWPEIQNTLLKREDFFMKKRMDKFVFWHLAWSLAQDLRKVKDAPPEACGLRHFLERPSEELRKRLNVITDDLGPKDVVIGVHLRYGDKFIIPKIENFTYKAKPASLKDGDDDRQVEMKLPMMNALVAELFSKLHKRNPKLRARIYVAADVPEALEAMQKVWKDRLLKQPNDKIAFHSLAWGASIKALGPGKNGKDNDHIKERVADLVADWYMLAVSDVIIQPMPSAFSDAAAMLGMHGPCAFLVKDSITPAAKSACVDSILKATAAAG